MPTASSGNVITAASQFVAGVVDSAAVLDDSLTASDIAANAVGDSEIAAHTTTKITVPFSKVTGTVPLNQGGTGQTAQGAAYDALNPNTTRGDITFRNATTNARLAAGTSGQFLKTLGNSADPVWAAAVPVIKVGSATYVGNSASSTQNIAHGLGSTPIFVMITASKQVSGANGHIAGSTGFYNGTTQGNSTYMVKAAATIAADAAGSTSSIVEIRDTTGGTDEQVAVCTVDGTNIILTWTKTGAPSGNNIFMTWWVM